MGTKPEDYQDENLVLQEYTKARIDSNTVITVDWNSRHKNPADYCMYYSKNRCQMSDSNMECEQPKESPLSELESMDTPPSDYIKQMKNFYYHHYVGQV